MDYIKRLEFDKTRSKIRIAFISCKLVYCRVWRILYICSQYTTNRSVKSHPTIIADERIPFVLEAFQPFGNLITLPGREMNAITIREADILIVRSVTPVDELLLGKSKVRYVATASTGYDHVDIRYLQNEGIHFFPALGCNANAVAEYIVVAIAELCRRYSLKMNELTLGIVGAGQIGTRVYEKANILGMNALLNDPPLKDKTDDPVYRSREDVLSQSDIVSLHVPLTDESPYPTRKMVDKGFLNTMKDGAFLINTSRGAVIDENVLLDYLSSGVLRGAVLDVWENEPAINTGLLERVEIGTPHIAGHSVDGKVNATVMVYNDLCNFLGIAGEWKPEGLPEPPEPVISVEHMTDIHKAVIHALLRAYPIEKDDARLRRLLDVEETEQATFFDSVRSEHLTRREFDSYYIRGGEIAVINTLTKLGFNEE